MAFANWDRNSNWGSRDSRIHVRVVDSLRLLTIHQFACVLLFESLLFILLFDYSFLMSFVEIVFRHEMQDL